jgi:hypothetical protein
LQERRSQNSDKYNFSISLEHSHHGPLTEAAISRLKNAIDELPGVRKKEHKIILDGGIKITLKRLDEKLTKASGDEGLPLSEMLKSAEGTPRFIIQSPIRVSDLEFNLSDLQLLFVKAFRVLAKVRTSSSEGNLPSTMTLSCRPAAANAFSIAWPTIPAVTMSRCSEPRNKLRKRHFESLRNQLQIQDRNITFPTLDIRQKTPINPYSLGHLDLSPTVLSAQLSNPVSQANEQVFGH